MSEDLNILFLGDIVGRPGRYAVKYFLENVEEILSCKPDLVIANAENASHGFGLTEKNYNDLLSYGVDILTSGNHIWDRKDIFNYIEGTDRLIRPINYPPDTPGRGSLVYQKDGVSYAVINFLGRVFMSAYESPWAISKEEILTLQSQTPIVIADFHAEASAEKVAFGKYLADFGVTAMVGTHTHVQTADESIINQTTAYITDVGACAATNGVIGMDYETSLKRLSTLLPVRYEVADIDKSLICGVIISVDRNTGIAKNITRIQHSIDLKTLLEEGKLLI